MNPDETHVNETLLASEKSSRLTLGQEGLLALNALLAEKYRVVGFIGEGASAKVYRVEQVYFRQEFAFKLFDKKQSDGKSIARFQREAQVSSQLLHPNLVRAVDFGVVNDDQPYLVMDLVHGVTLQDLLKQVGSLSLEQTIAVFAPICEGLSYAHARGLVHRDIKPGNIMLDGHTEMTLGIPKILDFGIARTLEAEAMNLTKTGEIFGTPLYMSPEQCAGNKADQRSDIYSLGCVIFEALTGAPPFAGETLIETITMHLNSEPLTLREASFGQEFPPALEKIIARMLSKNMEARYQDCVELRRDLLAFQSGKISEPSNSGGRSTESDFKNNISESSANRHIYKVATALAISVLIVAIALFSFHRDGRQTAEVNNSTPTPTPNHQTEKPSVVKTDEAPESEDLKSALKPGTFFSDPAGNPPSVLRRFKFPHQSIGQLQEELDISNGTEKFPAQDHVAVERTQKLSFQPSMIWLSQYPEILSHFRSDDIVGLQLTPSNEFTDSKYTLDDILLQAKGLTELQALDIHSPQLTIKGLKNMRVGELLKLRELTLNGTKVDMAELARFRSTYNLYQLTIMNQNTGLSKLLAALGKNSHLKKIVLISASVNDSDLQLIAGIPNLAAIYLRNNPAVTGKGIANLASMKIDVLALPGCHVMPTDIDDLKKLHVKNLTVPKKYWSASQASALESELHCTVQTD